MEWKAANLLELLLLGDELLREVERLEEEGRTALVVLDAHHLVVDRLLVGIDEAAHHPLDALLVLHRLLDLELRLVPPTLLLRGHRLHPLELLDELLVVRYRHVLLRRDPLPTIHHPSPYPMSSK